MIIGSHSDCVIEKDVIYTLDGWIAAEDDQACAEEALRISTKKGNVPPGELPPQYFWTWTSLDKTKRCYIFKEEKKTGGTTSKGYLSGSSECARDPGTGCFMRH